MCNLVVPVRTCSKCHRKERLFGDGTATIDSEKTDRNGLSGYMDPAQDCYSRWCVFSSEHPKSCSHCWLTCKHSHGRTREIQGGSPSYVCYSCVPRARRQQTWKPPRPIQTKATFRQGPSHGFPGVSRLVTALAR
ncbi:hypothetical protein V8B97DRAFT_311376 [Scleroderma yunnanense]